MRYFLTLSLTIIMAQMAAAQNTEDSVKAAVNEMFTAMRNADSAGLMNVFSPTAVLQTISRNKEGQTIVRTENTSGFGSSINKLAKGDADERITFGAVHIDGPMASVWTPYEFYFKGNFSHCGVNSFQLVRINGAWKIQYIIDTRRKNNCK
ncbi:MAG: nuclear transport factor 2 family protein [Chitinophagaceae bacterium]|nr:nuclear transport factor 2 family protein [Chitinophagaceae bacterium]